MALKAPELKGILNIYQVKVSLTLVRCPGVPHGMLRTKLDGLSKSLSPSDRSDTPRYNIKFHYIEEDLLGPGDLLWGWIHNPAADSCLQSPGFT